MTLLKKGYYEFTINGIVVNKSLSESFLTKWFGKKSRFQILEIKLNPEEVKSRTVEFSNFPDEDGFPRVIKTPLTFSVPVTDPVRVGSKVIVKYGYHPIQQGFSFWALGSFIVIGIGILPDK